MGLIISFGGNGTRKESSRGLYYANPMFIDDIATEFPEVPVIIGHCGMQSAYYYGYFADMALMVASRHPNVYLETSSAPYEVLLKAAEDPAIGPEKLIFGSDSPAFYGYYKASNGESYSTYGKTGPGEFVPDHYKYELKQIERLPVTEAQKQMILGGTIEKLLSEKI
ncbi:MAG: amidohydrolase family protein [Eubacterium sp.]|nr:amidohydrolase family protein [Eubacterium sp.]